MDLVVLSPHLDDAVFSLGSTIARLAAGGEKVTVITFFTQAPPPEEVPEKLRVFADYEVRRNEDTAALERLGARPVWLGLVERAFREPHLTAPSQVFTTPGEAEALPNLARIESEVTRVLSENPNARVVAPLGVGNHCDHVEVFVGAARALLASGTWDRLCFYEDAYALGRRLRRAHFVTRQHSWGITGGPDLQRLSLFGMFQYMASVRRGPPVEALLPPAVAAARWSVIRQPVDAADERAQLEALGCYASQLQVLGGVSAWEKALRRYHRFWSGGEPLWSAAPA